MAKTIQVLSDLHLEFLSPRFQEEFFRRLNPQGVDVLVLAGDITTLATIDGVLEKFCSLYPEVVYVLGNHELYNSSPDCTCEAVAQNAARLKNLTWLNNSSKRVSGINFFGGPLWVRAPRPEVEQILKYQITDFNLVQKLTPWIYDENKRFIEELNRCHPEVDVVVSHFLPSDKLIAPRFRSSSVLNSYFSCDLTSDLERWKIPLWVFGHTHDCIQKKIGDTTFLCNPKGYPFEKIPRGVSTEPGFGLQFDMNLRVEVSPQEGPRVLRTRTEDECS